MKDKVYFKTREGQVISSAGQRNYTTAQRAIKLAIGKGFVTVLAIDVDGKTYDYTSWLQSRISE